MSYSLVRARLPHEHLESVTLVILAAVEVACAISQGAVGPWASYAVNWEVGESGPALASIVRELVVIMVSSLGHVT